MAVHSCPEPMPIQFNDCQFDPSDGRLSGPGVVEPLTLRPQVARLLTRFLASPGELLDRDTLITAVWDAGSVVDFESGLAALMRELRLALDQIGAGAALIETIPRRGYRFHGELVTDEPGPEEPSAQKPSAQKPSAREPSAQEPSPHEPTQAAALETVRSERSKRRRWPAQGLLLSASIVLGLVLLAGILWLGRADQVADNGHTLAILPFDYFGSDEQPESRLGLLLADTILAELWRAELEGLELIGRATLRPYQNRVDVAAAVARDLAVDLLIEGAVVQAEDGGWRVDARLLRMPGGTVVWSAAVAVEHPEALPVPAVAEQLVAGLKNHWQRSAEP